MKEEIQQQIGFDKIYQSLHEDIPIQIDSKEPSDIVELIKAEGVPVEVKTLVDGDYIIGNVFWTRKTIADLFSSRNSAHLNDELCRLLSRYPYDLIILIIEKNKYNTRKEMEVSSKAAKTLNFYLPVLKSKSERETAETLIKYRKKIIRGELQFLRRRVRVISHKNPILQVYASLPGSGDFIARQIYLKYPVPYKFIQAIKKTALFVKEKYKTKKRWYELKWNAGIELLGNVKAERIEELILDGEFDGDD